MIAAMIYYNSEPGSRQAGPAAIHDRLTEDIQQILPLYSVPNTYLSYDQDLNPVIKKDLTILIQQRGVTKNDDPDLAGRAAEDAIFEANREKVKDLPVTYLDDELPMPIPGLTAMYGSDGELIRYWYEDADK